METPPRLELHGITKHFGGVRALAGADLAIRAGEVHGLLGENGSGKSTLIKILAGYHTPDAGELRIDGEPVPLPLHPGQFRRLGLSFVHQDLGLIPSVSVLENLRIGQLAASRWSPWISWTSARREAKVALARYGVELDPNTPVSTLRPVERALLAIVRAVEGIRRGSGILVLDEPTVFLPRTDVDRLFALVREVAATEASVLFVSHDLDEVSEITDAVTVLRDGRNVGTVTTASASKAELVELIIGHRLAELGVTHTDLRDRTPSVVVDDLCGGGVESMSFDVHEGEVIGVTGLVGSGFEDVPYLLFGAVPADRGELRIDGRRLVLSRLQPRAALDAGVALLPADRDRDGALTGLSVADNITMQTIDSFFRRGVINRQALRRRAREVAAEFDVRPADPTMLYSALSGGNQQKALLGKWLQTNPRLLILHEPTQGVDVGAREQIFEMISRFADGGSSVICASSDYEQLAIVCDRVLVLGRGRVTAEMVGDDVTKERITERAYASAAPAGAEGGRP